MWHYRYTLFEFGQTDQLPVKCILLVFNKRLKVLIMKAFKKLIDQVQTQLLWLSFKSHSPNRLYKVWVYPAKLWWNFKTWAMSKNNPVRHIHSLQSNLQSTLAPNSPHPCDPVKAGTCTYVTVETHLALELKYNIAFDQSPCNVGALKWANTLGLVGNSTSFQWCHSTWT